MPTAMLCAATDEQGGVRHHGALEGSHGSGIPLVPQLGDETDDALRQDIGLLEHRKMAAGLRDCPAPDVEESLRITVAPPGELLDDPKKELKIVAAGTAYPSRISLAAPCRRLVRYAPSMTSTVPQIARNATDSPRNTTPSTIATTGMK
jgi:hypothetical protein